MGFQKATKHQAKLRMALTGPAGSGKTYTALAVAAHLGGRIAVVDTEHGSASKYADGQTPTGQLSPRTGLFAFDTMTLDNFHPQRFIDAIAEAAAAGYDVLVIDSLSHAWAGKGGGLDIHDQTVARQKTENKYTAWAPVTKTQNELVEAIIAAPLHIIATMRSKMEYAQENGRVKKLGMAPIQRDGMEYEFDVVGDMDLSNTITVSKTRCSSLKDYMRQAPGKELAAILKAWLSDGAVADAERKPTPPTPAKANGNGTQSAEKAKGFLDNLNTYAAKLAADKHPGANLLIPHIATEGMKQGFPNKLTLWTSEQIAWARKETEHFLAECLKPKQSAPAVHGEVIDEDRAKALRSLAADADEAEADIMAEFGYADGLTLDHLRVADAEELEARLRKVVADLAEVEQ